VDRNCFSPKSTHPEPLNDASAAATRRAGTATEREKKLMIFVSSIAI
jgi:hypothetical protein